MDCPGCFRPIAADQTTCPHCGADFNAATIQPDQMGDTADGNPEAIKQTETPASIGKYAIIREIGRGAMGKVYLAEDPDLDRRVALKTMIAGEAATEQSIARFMSEARSAGKLKHPGIVSVHEAGQEGALHFLVMDYIAGHTLEELIDNRKLKPRRTAEIIRDAAFALFYAHEHGIIHRDIKPANIMVTHDGAVHIMDFGLARNLESDSSLTRTGEVMGTPLYLNPEQAGGNSKLVDARSDVYSLGAVFYEALTGEPPVQGDNVMSIILEVMDYDPIPPCKLNSGIAKDLEIICLKAMFKEPERRYSTAREFAEDLERFINGEPIQARPASFLYRLGKRMRKSRTAIIAVMIALIISLSGTFWYRSYMQAEQERASAQAEKLIEENKSITKQLAAERQKTQKRWRTVFSDTGKRTVLDPDWRVMGGQWFYENGRLNGVGGGGKMGGTLILGSRFAGDLRFSFTASAQKHQFPEIGFFVFGNETDPLESGYFISLQSKGLRVDRNRVTLYQTDRLQLEPDREYRIVFNRNGRSIDIRLAGDPEPLIAFEDWDPPVSTSNNICGLYLWRGRTVFSDIQIDRAALPMRASPLDFARYLKAQAAYPIAVETLKELLSSTSDLNVRAQALLLMADCYEGLGEFEKAEENYARIMTEFSNEEYAMQYGAYRIRRGVPPLEVLTELEAHYRGSSYWIQLVGLVFAKARGMMLEDADKQAIQALLMYGEQLVRGIEDARVRDLGLQSIGAAYLSLWVSPRPPALSLWLIKRAAECSPGNYQAWHQYCRVVRSKNMPADFLKAADAFRQQNPGKHMPWAYYGEALTVNGRLEEALAAYHQSIALYPDTRWVWNKLIDLYTQLGRTEEIEPLLRRQLDAHPHKEWPAVIFFQYIVKQHDFQHLLQETQRYDFDKLNINSPLYYRGMALFETGRREEGAAMIRRYLANMPEQVEVWQALARLYIRMDRMDTAVTVCKEAVEANPRSIVLLLTWAGYLSRNDDYQQAVHVCGIAREMEPRNPQVWQQLSWTYLQGSKPRKAAEAALNAVTIQPSLKSAWSAFAWSIEQQGQPDAAISRLKQFMHKSPGNPVLPLICGEVASRNHQYAVAESCFKSLFELRPYSYEGLIGAGINAIASGQYPAAIEYAETFLKHFPDYYFGYEIKAYALLEMKRFDNALAVLETYQQHQLPVADLHAMTAYILIKQGRLQEGQQYLSETREAGLPSVESTPTVHYWIARALAAQGQTESAFNILNEILKSGPVSDNHLMPVIRVLHHQLEEQLQAPAVP